MHEYLLCAVTRYERGYSTLTTQTLIFHMQILGYTEIYLIVSVTVSILVSLFFFCVRQEHRVRFELVAPTVMTMRSEDEPLSIPLDTQLLPLPVPPAHAPRSNRHRHQQEWWGDHERSYYYGYGGVLV